MTAGTDTLLTEVSAAILSMDLQASSLRGEGGQVSTTNAVLLEAWGARLARCHQHCINDTPKAMDDMLVQVAESVVFLKGLADEFRAAGDSVSLAHAISLESMTNQLARAHYECLVETQPLDVG